MIDIDQCESVGSINLIIRKSPFGDDDMSMLADFHTSLCTVGLLFCCLVFEAARCYCGVALW